MEIKEEYEYFLKLGKGIIENHQIGEKFFTKWRLYNSLNEEGESVETNPIRFIC